ncbi:hypothetical protein C6500_17170 [Candidatus Poribacteria bacterium]|nr:MAG: hypothetical protein C6500_17170 [Candidatus Poribacteria bacterium]
MKPFRKHIFNYGSLGCPPLRFGQVSGQATLKLGSLKPFITQRRLELTENHRETKWNGDQILIAEKRLKK